MSCLFDSISQVVLHNGKSITSYHLRQLICDELEKNPRLIDDLKFDEITQITMGITKKQYINKMRNHQEWGSGLEIKCFCNMFRCVVNVYHRGKNITFLPDTSPLYNINLKYTGNHYTLISSNIL